MAKNGFVFNNYYTSYMNTTTNGEFAFATGLWADVSRYAADGNDVGSFARSSDNYMPYGLGNLFAKEGVSTYAYHGYIGSYYRRCDSWPNLGYETIKFMNDGMTFINKYSPSDRELMEQSVDDYINDDRFLTYYMTFSGHGSYTTDTYMYLKNNEEVRALLEGDNYSDEQIAYYCGSYELEKAMEYLFERLETAGKLDNTLIVMASDHVPCSLSDEALDDFYTRQGLTLSNSFEMYHSTLIMYDKSVENPIVSDEYCCNVDVLPTVLNLLGINYDSRLLMGNDISSLTEILKRLNDNALQYEGDSFHILIDPLIESSINDNQRKLRIHGYPEKMNLIFSKEKDFVYSDSEFETRKIVPQLNPQGDNRFFMILPLHDNEYEVGYVVMADDFSKVKRDQLLRKYMERINIILNRFFQKLRLDALNNRLLQMTETDAMTHVKNRTAFETRLGDLQNKMSQERRTHFSIVVFDINNLKSINDNLGHEAGDEYIINACRLICKTFKRSAVYRIGGDEFVAVLTKEDYDMREKLLYGMRIEMEHLATMDLPVVEKVSIASGIADYNFSKDFNVSDVFNRADSAMYENKTVMKMELGDR